jgi:uncharacterized protein (DUF111 family)
MLCKHREKHKTRSRMLTVLRYSVSPEYRAENLDGVVGVEYELRVTTPTRRGMSTSKIKIQMSRNTYADT